MFPIHKIALNLLIILAVAASSCLSDAWFDGPLAAIKNAAFRVNRMVNCPNHASKIKSDTHSKIILSQSEKESFSVKYDRTQWPDKTVYEFMMNGFNSSAPTILYLHGYIGGPQTLNWAPKVIRDAHELASPGHRINLMLLDWSRYARLPYRMSVAYVPHVGEVVGKLIELFDERIGYAPSNWHLVGYSLSTHIIGQAGRYVSEHMSQRRIRQITAIDPTGVCMHDTSFGDKYGLGPEDAELVVARHYDFNGLGAKRPIGGLDIYINDGHLSRTKRNAPTDEDEDNVFSEYYKANALNAEFGDVIASDEDELPDRQFMGSLIDHIKAIHQEADMHRNACKVAYECESYEKFARGECRDCGDSFERCFNMSNLDYERYIGDSGLTSGEGRAASYKLGTRMYARSGTKEC